MAQYLIPNGAMQTTAALVPVTTGTAIKTMLQVKPSATLGMKIIAWGISFDGSAAATPIRVELIETGTVFGTVTASAAADLTKYDAEAIGGGDPTTNLIVVGTTATGYTCTSEGSITAVRNLDTPRFVAPTNSFDYQFPLGREPFVQVSNAMRIRVTAAAAVNCYCYVVVEV